MQSVIKYLKEFYLENNKIQFWIGLHVIFVVFLLINYSFDFENKYIDIYTTSELFQIFIYFCFYAVPYITVVSWYVYCFGKNTIVNYKVFIFRSIFVLLLLSIYVSIIFYYDIIYKNFPYEVHYFMLKCANNLKNTLFIFPVLLIWWYFMDRKQTHLYGFSTKQFDYKPYLMMFSVIIPLVVIASFTDDFIKAYPRYKPGYPDWNHIEEYWKIEGWKTTLTFEMFYGLDFIFTEFFFRGFFLITLYRFGGNAGLFGCLMVYVFIHFQKPLGETIGSFYGGLVLTVLALKTRSIYGGIIAHLGMAWLMEIASILQIYFRK